jgi:hypothetical protein
MGPVASVPTRRSDRPCGSPNRFAEPPITLSVMALTIHDETPGGRTISTFVLADAPSTISLRELIKLRIRDEVARHNANPTIRFNGFVRPLEAEEQLNGDLLYAPRRIDW